MTADTTSDQATSTFPPGLAGQVRPASAGPDDKDSLVVGVDFGTLSARAVVVRASDGAELGSGLGEYAHGSIERTLPASGKQLPPDWALQDPADWREALGTAVREALRDAGADPSAVVGIGTDFTACTVLPVLRDGTPLCELPELRDKATCLAQAVEAPRGAAAGRPDQRPRPQARRAVDRPVRRAGLLGVAVRQGTAAARRGPGHLPADRAVG